MSGLCSARTCRVFCAEKCTDDNLNVWCDVCGIQGADFCEGEAEAETYETTVTYTAIDGTAGATSSESCSNLFDGKYETSNHTKWCVDKFSGSAYVIFSASEPVLVNGYSFVTGNDNTSWTGRNPKSWTLYGCNNADASKNSEDWQVLHKVSNDTVLQDKNCTKYDFVVEGQTTKYQYFMLKIESNQSGKVMQLGELIMDGSTCEHIYEAVVTEPTCTEQGYTTYTCGLCGISYKRNFTELLAHDFGDDDFCTMCGTARIKDFTLQDAQSDEYTYKNGVLTIVKDGAQLTIANTDSNTPTSDTIVVNKDVSANITLAGVNIDVSDTTDACAFKIEDDSTGNVTITLADGTKNTLKSGKNCAGLQKNGTGDGIGTLTIQGGENDTGSLTATAGSCGAGIGGGNNGASSRIIINGGTVTAKADTYAAGIGGGYMGAGSEITISGGTVNATGASYGAGIGGGRAGVGSKITISGGIITTTGGYSGAGIGGGSSEGYEITISGGIVTATGGQYAAGIGGGYMEDGSKIIISGGSVKAVGGYNANNIGGGYAREAVDPTNDEGNKVYLMEINSGYNQTLIINGTEFTPTRHNGESKVYFYFEAGTYDVQVGNQDAVTYKYFEKFNKFLSSKYSLDFSITGGEVNKDYVEYEDTLYLLTDTPLTIANRSGKQKTTDKIVVSKDVSANITLAGVHIDVSSTSYVGAFKIEDNSTGNVTITLADDTENILKSGYTTAGLQKNGVGKEIGTLTIQGEENATGSLIATGGSNGAGIGSGNGAASSKIIIRGGIVTTTGGTYSAGIGGGSGGAASEITISGGTVTSTGGFRGAGIGGGSDGAGSGIIVSGGNITATGDMYGAGIGGGSGGTGSEITISGGIVTATGDSDGAGIGGGENGAGSKITISGGIVTATGDDYGAGIGGGENGAGSEITISGGIVTATGDMYGAGIGGGYRGEGSQIIISGGSVKAVAGNYAKEIGGWKQKGDEFFAEAVIPTNSNGNSVYLMKIDNENNETIKINGKEFVPTKHNEENSVYVYLEADTYDVQVGNAQPVRYEYIEGINRLVKVSYNLDLTITGGEVNKDYVGYEDTLYILTETPLTIANKSGVEITTDKIIVCKDISANITLAGVHIDVSETSHICAFEIEDYSTGNVTITLAAGTENILKSGYYRAGLQKNGAGDTIGTLTIQGKGSLVATGGNYGAGIGGGRNGAGSKIIIRDGSITSIGAYDGAGIGGGSCGAGSEITISGGVVTATGGDYGVGIGGGYYGACSEIIISGGSVKVVAGSSANEIGGWKAEEDGSIAEAVLPTDDKGNPVYLMKIDNEKNETIKIDGKEFAPTKHNEENKVYVYLKADTYAVQVGDKEAVNYEYIKEINRLIKASCSLSFSITGGEVNKDYVDCDNTLYILTETPLIIANAELNTVTTDRIVVCKDVSANITLAGLSIDAGDIKKTSAFKIEDNSTGKVTITLAKDTENFLNSGSSCAGLQKNGAGDTIGTLTIQGEGRLTAIGGLDGAGIGSGYYEDCSKITISEGTITATGGEGGAGIGGGYHGTGSEITLSGGTITATGGRYGAGIGGCGGGAGSRITISGGSVTATGGVAGAGIGGAYGGAGSEIIISAGTVNATGGHWGAGIGGAYTGEGSQITISEGSVNATGGDYGAGIGGGSGEAGFEITISGGTVTTAGGENGAGIGGGLYGTGSQIIISGGSVKAVAGSEANMIGGGKPESGTISSVAVIPTDDEENNVYLMEINNTSEADITINDKEYPKQHSIEEQKIYAYLPAKTSAEPNVVNVGSDVQKYCYKKSKSKWFEVVTIPEADDRTFECNGSEQTYALVESEYYTISDNLTQTDAGTYIITVTLNDPQNTIWNDDTTEEKKYTFTIKHVDEVYDGICDVCGLCVEAKAIAKENCEELGLDDSYIGYYVISNGGNLMWFAQQVQAGNTGYKAVLTADIDMSGMEWIPIGTIDQAYAGIFDGRGHVISNVKVMGDDDTENYGVFGTVSGTFKNLGVNSLTYNGKEKNGCAGGIAGALLTGGKVDNCYVIHSTIQSTDHVIGGIVGNNAGTISNSYSYDNTLNGAENRMGGICGDYVDGRITNCYTNSNELGSAEEGFAGTATDSEAGVADSRFMSGEIAYQLNGSTVQGVLVWGQKLKTEEAGAEFDSLPVFKNDSNTVYYGYANCQTKEKFYSNAELYDEVPDHDWVYTQDETNKINFACDTAGCTKGGTVEIMVPTNATYHKDKQVATVQVNTEGDENLIKTPEITYSSMTEGVELVDGEPVYAGRYQASITLGEVTAYDEFEIAKAVPEIGTVSANTLENTLDINQIVLSRTDETIAGSLSLKEGTSLQYGTNDYTYVFHSQDENYADKEGTVSITITDTIAPTATYQIGTNGFKSFMNAITFGYFFKNTQNVEIEYTDDSTDKDGNILVKGSGVDAKQYYIASEIVAEEAIADIEWVEYTQPISLDKNGKYFVYTKVTDHAGNTAILNSDGIVIYEESVITTTSADYNYKSNKNITFEINANGNTFKALKDGTGNDVSAEYYIVTDNSKITFKAEYLDTLNVAEQPYTYKIYMNPQGVEASNPESSKPELCYEITINVLAKALTVTGATATERTYEKGNTSVVITSIDLAGKMEGDNVSVDVTGLAGTLSDADAGNYTEVVLPKLELTGSDKGNYVLTQPSEAVPTNVTISPLTTGTATSVTNKYLYLKESADKINLEALLPKDCGAIVSYDTPNVEGNVTYKVTPSITNGTLAYTVAESSEEAIGSKGTINVNVKTQNYANVPISITVEFIDQIPVNPQTDVKLKDNNQKLTYGQKLSTLELSEVTFKGTDGEIVIGTLQWKNGESIPNVATEKVAWEFIPSASYNEKYASAEGELNIEVIPATPYIQVLPTATSITYGMSLNDSTLNGGTVQHSQEDATTVVGTWSWKETDTKPVVADSDVTQYSVIFVPEDEENYNKAEGTVTLTVNKAENTPNKPESIMSALVSQKTVGAVELPEGWVWSEDDKAVVLKVGEDNKVTATAIYDGKDKGNYVIEYVEITIVCQACTHPADKQELRDVKAATCGEAGYTGDNYCKDCGEKIETGEEISTLAHIYGEPIFNWSEDRKSCIITFTCMNDTEHISTQDATITSAIKTEATCKDKGTTTYTATYADIDKVYSAEGKRYTNTKDVVDIPVNETLHVESEILYTGDGEKEPTCTESGIGHTECMNCNQSMKSNVSIEATGHTGGTSNCKDKAVCVVCGNSYGKVSTVHTWDGGVVSKEATANEKGEKTYTCSVCKTTRTEEIPVLGEPDVEEPDVGTELISEDGSTIYLVTNVGANGNTVTYAGLKDKNATTAIVPTTVTINNITYTVTAISDTAFANNKKITSVTIGDNVTSFSTKTFKGCTNLKTLNTGNGVTSIPANAFKNFKNLTTVIVGTKVKTIGKNAFYGCKKLKTVTIGKSVSKIGAKAFYGCSKLKTLTIKSTKLTTKKIGSKAFGKTPKSMTVKIPKKKMKAYKSMLKKRGVNKKARFKKI